MQLLDPVQESRCCDFPSIGNNRKRCSIQSRLRARDKGCYLREKRPRQVLVVPEGVVESEEPEGGELLVVWVSGKRVPANSTSLQAIRPKGACDSLRAAVVNQLL
jgi:hypothetical protein